MNRTPPPLTPELAYKLEASCTFFSTEKQKALASLPGNPYGVQTRTFGKATAFLARKTHNSEIFNHVGNLTRDDLPYLDAILDWYAHNDVSCSFDIVPSNASPELLWHLAMKGLYQSSFYNMFYGLPYVAQEFLSDIVIRPVLPEEKNLFAEVYFESFEVPKTKTYAYVRQSICTLVEIPTNHCLFAFIHNSLAAIAVISISRGIGYLALSATRPSFRGRGCQNALLQARIHLASRAGCDLVTCQAGVGTVSQRNVEKVGLRLAYTKATWTTFNEHQNPRNTIDPTNR
ncbi:MAG TPA: hypothetical protein DHW02_02910 [Ktedonobacter sp.]|nr:hypothetical protein [Ktedonobacter sp.]